jgi:hypothetical protein
LFSQLLGELLNRETEVPVPIGSNDAGDESVQYQHGKNMVAAAPAAPQSKKITSAVTIL